MFGCPKLYSQTVRSHIDKSCMKIGEQAHFRISAVAESSADVHFPPNDSILQRIKGVEILSTNDSISKYHTSVCRSRIYTITSFDPSVYSFSSLPVVIDGTLFKTGNISLTVQGVEIDTTHVEKIYDLKSAMRPPFSYSEWIWPLIISLVSLLLTILLIYIAIRIKDNKPHGKEFMRIANEMKEKLNFKWFDMHFDPTHRFVEPDGIYVGTYFQRINSIFEREKLNVIHSKNKTMIEERIKNTEDMIGLFSTRELY